MKRRNMFQMGVLLLLGMGVLLSLAAFDRPGLRREADFLELTVLLRETDSGGWSATRQGMEQAAVDLGAELRFLSLNTPNDTNEQKALLIQETESGTDGILLVPSDPSALADAVKEIATQIPVVTLESDMTDSGAAACISVDNVAIGEALGRMAINGIPPGGTAFLLNSVPGRAGGISCRLEAAAAVLESAGREVRRGGVFGEVGIQEALAVAFEEEQPDAVLVFEPFALEETARYFRDIEDSAPLLYGMGASNGIASGLERGDITAIVAQNEFAVGYLAVEAAVRAARGQKADVPKPVLFSIIRQENMYHTDHQELLFPVTR